MESVRTRLEELCKRHGLPEGAAGQLEVVLGLLEREPTSLTAVRDPGVAVDVHVADSLAGLEIDRLGTARVIADLGSGTGFPGLPLAVALPHSQVTLVESVGKKCRFLERAVEAAGVLNAGVRQARAEEWPEGVGRQEAVVARALAPLAVLVEYAAPLLGIGGVLVAWKGRPEAQEEADGEAAARVLGLEPEGCVAVQPFPAARDRRLYVYLKVREAPAGYPRRAGMARKRPLRAR